MKPSKSSLASFSYEGQDYDYLFQSWLGRYTHWLSPASYSLAFSDWLMHLAISPARQIDIIKKASENHIRLIKHFAHQCDNNQCAICNQHPEQNSRFESTLWNNFPFNVYSQYFLLMDKLWNEASGNICGVSKHHLNVVNFSGRQILDMLSPSNFILTNPEVLQATIQQSGDNLIRGFNNFANDISCKSEGQEPFGTQKYKVGINVAITKGKVIYRNHLIELIQYEPTTSKVFAEPLLIIPAWIMKYYILDLSEHNSFVKYLVNKGHTVFMISWKNPNSEDRELSLNDYVNLGILQALNAINHIIPKKKSMPWVTV